MRRVYWFFRLLIESILNGVVNRSVTLSLSVVMFLLLGLVIIGAGGAGLRAAIEARGREVEEIARTL